MDIILLIAKVFSTPFMQQGYGQRAPVSGLWSRGLAHLRAGANQLARLLLHDGDELVHPHLAGITLGVQGRFEK